MRLVIGGALVYRASFLLMSHPSSLLATASLLLIGAGILLMLGLWTPIAGTIVALVELWKILTLPGDKAVWLLLGTIGCAVAMLGPGLWSVDARLFGWKRVEAPPRKSSPISR